MGSISVFSEVYFKQVYFCLKNPMDREALQATVQWVTKIWDTTEQVSTVLVALGHVGS